MSEETYLPLLENLVITSIGEEVLGASLPKATLANTTAPWLTRQQQRPIHGPNMVPFPGGPNCKLITLVLFHYEGGNDLSSLEYRHIMAVDFSSLPITPLPAPTICGITECLI